MATIALRIASLSNRSRHISRAQGLIVLVSHDWRNANGIESQRNRGCGHGTYTSFENFQTSRDRDFYVCGRSGDVRRGAHIRPPACRGNTRLCAADRQGMRLVPREQIGRRCPHRSRQGFPEEPQIMLRRARRSPAQTALHRQRPGDIHRIAGADSRVAAAGAHGCGRARMCAVSQYVFGVTVREPESIW